MGSSCFSRGNGLNAEHLQRMMEAGLLGESSSIELVGCLCEGQCKDGPIITIDGTRYQGVSPGILEDILRTHRERKAPGGDGGCA